MIVLTAIIFGAVLGALTARRRGGRRLDMLQYGAGYGIAFGLLGMIATVVLSRLA